MEQLLIQSNAAESLLQASENEVNILIPFNDQVMGTYTAQGNGAELEGLYTVVEELSPGGGTDMYQAAAQGIEELRGYDLSQYTPAVILLTDGQSGGSFRQLADAYGNLGSQAAEYLLELEPAENLIFCGYSEEALKKFAERGVETRVTNFNFSEGLKEAFTGAERLALISMPFVGAKRQNAHKNVVDAAKAAGVKQVIYTSLVNAGDETNPSVEKKGPHLHRELYQGFRPGLHLPAELPVRRGHDYQLLHLCKAGRRAEEQPGRRQDGLHLPEGLRQGGGLRPAPGRRV